MSKLAFKNDEHLSTIYGKYDRSSAWTFPDFMKNCPIAMLAYAWIMSRHKPSNSSADFKFSLVMWYIFCIGIRIREVGPICFTQTF